MRRSTMRHLFRTRNRTSSKIALFIGRSHQVRSLWSPFASGEQQQQELKDNEEEFPPSANPPDPENPDPATLREQWRYAVSLYSRWYSHAWGSAILAGLAFYGIGWFVKGGNPIPSDRPDASRVESASETS
ncbi:hypothetical protein KP509_37G022400 [Ceratopteris richardii]|uniref:Uncharacterized protein n=1 Tax=Ceratopteris richardii TaxID=49495 RepID=A0A8T2Q780_CERRI|nr:hypothetical protein KP509_37G022400 [Ceratopteris richardii]